MHTAGPARIGAAQLAHAYWHKIFAGELIDHKSSMQTLSMQQHQAHPQSGAAMSVGCLVSPEVASVHAGPEDDTLFQAQLLNNIMLHSGSCCGGERHQWHLGIPVRQTSYGFMPCVTLVWYAESKIMHGYANCGCYAQVLLDHSRIGLL